MSSTARVEEGLLAEVFTNEGVGTLIYGNEFQQIRRALKKDVRSILNLTKGSVETEELVKRTRSTIEKQLGDYYIFEIDKNPVACVALHIWPEHGKGELACLYVSPAHENQGIGRKLVQFVENKAREMGLNELIALSTQAFTYFQSKGGFVEGTPDDLPPVAPGEIRPERPQFQGAPQETPVVVQPELLRSGLWITAFPAASSNLAREPSL